MLSLPSDSFRAHYQALVTTGALEPDAAIVVDVTHATDAPGIEVKEAGKH